MAGDHKCPVCQATFTRPQHVARHMRSHTGDRPYKCQYCGDQFARSDLLARHINKCHANEKPPPNTVAGTRRKGSAAASRATTSKQACDQCVQSTLPCDGANPCSKCVSRKCRCTYVKFHRQTAPSGPGHQAPRSPSSSSPLASRLPPHLDDFILAPPPPPLASFPGSDQVFNTPFTFNPAAPAYPPAWAASDMSQVPFTIPPDVDITAKYRAQADLLRRVGLPPTVSSSSPTLLPSMYATQPHQAPSNWYPAWGESGTCPPLDDTKPYDGIARTHSFTSSEPPSFTPEVYGAALVGSAYRPRRVSLDFSDSSSATSQSVPSSAASSSVHLPLPANEMFESPSGEIQSQAHEAHMSVLHPQRRSSMPSSSLPPLFPGLSEPPASHPPLRAGEGGFSSAFGLMSIDDPNALPSLTSDGMPFFSNLGVGVMPHSPNATPMPTRMQQHANPHVGRERVMSLSALPTPRLSKEASETRELKDMWKTYLRSPLSGSAGTTAALDGSLPVSTAQPPTSLPQHSTPTQLPQSPSGQRRRVRVSSLPSVTPTVEKAHPWMVNGVGQPARSTTMHDDLKSYEAAVNARSASLKLNLVPRRRGLRPGDSGSGSPQTEGGSGAPILSASSSTGSGPLDSVDQQISRPSSSSSSSSLAQAFTVHTSQHPHAQTYHHTNQSQHAHQAHHQALHAHPHVPVSLAGLMKSPPMQGASISLPIPPPSMSMFGAHPHTLAFGSASTTSLPLDATGDSSSRESSVTSDGSHGTGTGGSGSDSEPFRPSFKRYPSQTLEPATSKRALVERPGGSKSVKKEKRRSEDSTMREERIDVVGGGERERKIGPNAGMASTGAGSSSNGGVGMGSPGSRPIVGLPERARRG